PFSRWDALRDHCLRWPGKNHGSNTADDSNDLSPTPSSTAAPGADAASWIHVGPCLTSENAPTKAEWTLLPHKASFAECEIITRRTAGGYHDYRLGRGRQEICSERR